MKHKLHELLVFCDMDNTLLTAKAGIPECNRTVMQLFRRMGGRLTVASGRPPASVKAALGDLKLSLPAICCNGSLLYDFFVGPGAAPRGAQPGAGCGRHAGYGGQIPRHRHGGYGG